MARQPAGSPLLAKLIEEYEYDGLQTCAADGTCATHLPARDRHRRPGQGAARRRARTSARSGRRCGRRSAGTASRPAPAPAWPPVLRRRQAIGDGRPRAESPPPPGGSSAPSSSRRGSAPMPPPGAGAMPPTVREGAAAVYLPACVNRIFGRDPAAPAPATAIPSAPPRCRRRWSRSRCGPGVPLWIPTGIAGSCCGTPWVSKGYSSGAEWMAARTVADLWRWSDEGRLPVVVDATSCTLGLHRDGAAPQRADRRAPRGDPDRRLDRVGAPPRRRARRSASGSAPWSSIRPARRTPRRQRRSRRARRRRWPRRSSSRSRRPAAASRATAASCTRS